MHGHNFFSHNLNKKSQYGLVVKTSCQLAKKFKQLTKCVGFLQDRFYFCNKASCVVLQSGEQVLALEDLR